MPAKLVRQAEHFIRLRSKLERRTRDRLEKLMGKAVLDPHSGKPMRFARKGTRELYLPPYRLPYAYDEKEEILTFLDLYHKDKQ